MTQTQAGKVGAEAITVNWRISNWFPELNDNIQNKLKELHSFLLLMNRSVNLIGVKTIPHADLLHFADSILAHRIILTDPQVKVAVSNNLRFLDLGSGNGFPGLVFSILSPDIQFTLVDHDAKKCEYLKAAIHNLGLPNCNVVASPLERLSGGVDLAIVRDLSTISKVLMTCRDKFKVGGSLYHMKGEEWSKEVADIPSQLCSFWSPSLVSEYKLPVGEWRFAVVKTKKIK